MIRLKKIKEFIDNLGLILLNECNMKSREVK